MAEEEKNMMDGAAAGTDAGATLSEQDRAMLVGLNEQRENMYGLLSRLYKVEMDADFYKGLCEAAFPAATGNDDVDAGYRRIALYCASHRDDALLDLARDYARVFIGHGNNAYAAAYPFESVYTSEKRLLMQEARDEIVEAYRESGFAVDASWEDPEDHIALELEFMQVMCGRTAKALKEGKEDEAVEMLKTQRAFVGQHLANWVPMFVSDIKYFSQTDLYIGAGELLLGFVQTEVEALDDLLDGVDA